MSGLSLKKRLRERQGCRLPAPQGTTARGAGNLAPPEPALDFPGSRIVTTPQGTYLHLTEYRSGTFEVGGDPQKLYSCLELLYGVGPYNARKLREEGYTDLRSLVNHQRWGRQARKLVQAIADGDIAYLGRFGADEYYLLGYFGSGDVVFLDLETTGLNGTRPLFLIGTMVQREGGLACQQYLARSFDEEAAAVAAALEFLKGYPVWVSFNGRCFDAPYLRTRAEYYGMSFPQPILHIDLLSAARKLYRGILPNCRLTTLEAYLLNRVRFDDVPGHLIPDLYHRFVVEQKPELMLGILRHNVEDLYSLSQLMSLVRERQQMVQRVS